MGARTLLPLVTLDAPGAGIRFLNHDSKVTAFLFLQEQRVSRADVVFRTANLQGTRGYCKDFKKVSRFYPPAWNR